MKILVVVGTGLLCGLLVSQGWASKGTDGVHTALQADDLVVVHAGEIVYRKHCAACHGAYLEGQADWRKRDASGILRAPPHDATGHTWHHADDLLFEIVKYGMAAVIGDSEYRSAMPIYENILSDDEIVAVLSFIKNSWPEEERSWQEEVNGSTGEGFIPQKQQTPSALEKLFK